MTRIYCCIAGLTLLVALGCGPTPGNGDDDDDNQSPTPSESPTPTGGQVPVAQADNDSLQAPADSYFMTITGTQDFTFQDDVSAPNGDLEDFVEFEFPNNSNPDQTITVTLDCTFQGDPNPVAAVLIYEDGVDSGDTVFCNEGQQTVVVDNTKVQTAVVKFTVANEDAYMEYTLTVVGFN